MRDLGEVPLVGADAARLGRVADPVHAVDAAGPQQRLVQRRRHVGRHHDQDAVVRRRLGPHAEHPPDHPVDEPARLLQSGQLGEQGLHDLLGVEARRRSTPAPKGTSTSWRSGRCRVRTARASTLTMRTSPLSLATAGSSTPRTRTSGTSPDTVERLTPGLAERGKHLLDVAQEERVGPDHEHALALEREAVGVEEIGGAVQRHRRLARTRAALDDQDAGERRADDLVLLALDGPDDVAHVPGAGLAEGGEQRAGAAEHHPVGEQALAAGDGHGAVAGSIDGRRWPAGRRGRRSTRPRARATLRPRTARWRRRARPWGSSPVAR